MSFFDSSAPVNQANAPSGQVTDRVRRGLAGRRISATPDQEKRLRKALERLEPAADAALAAGFGVAVPEASFSAVLVQLSHA